MTSIASNNAIESAISQYELLKMRNNFNKSVENHRADNQRSKGHLLSLNKHNISRYLQKQQQKSGKASQISIAMDLSIAALDDYRLFEKSLGLMDV